MLHGTTVEMHVYMQGRMGKGVQLQPYKEKGMGIGEEQVEWGKGEKGEGDGGGRGIQTCHDL
jgi:hypothetical protein